MDRLTDTVRLEIEDLHAFFEAWFNGSIDQDQLDFRFLSHMSDDMVFVSTGGRTLGKADFRAAFQKSYGCNPKIRIQVRDVQIEHRIGTTALVTYTEWQTGAGPDQTTKTGRISSALMDVQPSILWHHIHETWLPDDVQAKGPF